MASMANISLVDPYNNIPTVNAVALSPSAGDSVPARWRIETSLAPIFRPKLTLVARPNAKGDVRRVLGKIEVPYVEIGSTSPLPFLVSAPFFNFELVVPQITSSNSVYSIVAYAQAFLSSAVVRESLIYQLAPT